MAAKIISPLGMVDPVGSIYNAGITFFLGKCSSGSQLMTIPVFHNFSVYLKTVYGNSPVSSDGKWPPTPSKQFVNLAMIALDNDGDHKWREEYIGHTLKENGPNRMLLPLEKVLESHGSEDQQLVLVQGAPGIGKSTLAWELCRRWENFSCMQIFSLVILLRLREKEVQSINNVAQLFYSYEGEDKKSLVRKALTVSGKGILFILDGFDELPVSLQKESFLIRLVKGTVLPKCSVLVTTRPSATAQFFTVCRPRISKQVEVLGFTQTSVQEYANSIFSKNSKMLKSFMTYISASSNPAINSLMYIPLNAAIIVEIFRDFKAANNMSDLPHTLTELYTQLCLTILKRFLHAKNLLPLSFQKFENLPKDLYQKLKDLSEIAFTGMWNEEVIFHSLPSDLIHFGFLDASPSLYGGGNVSYNFLHLTLQEFFAAYYISLLPGERCNAYLKQFGNNSKWSVVWRFVAGITKFQHFHAHVGSAHYRELFGVIHEHELHVTIFLMQCLFEAQVEVNFDAAHNIKACVARFEVRKYAPLDEYALGYSISMIRIPWKIFFVARPSSFRILCTLRLHRFHCGLKSRPVNGIIKELHVSWCEVDTTTLKSMACYLNELVCLRLANCQLNEYDMTVISELLPDLKNLTEFSIPDNPLLVVPDVFAFTHFKLNLMHMNNTEANSRHLLELLPHHMTETPLGSISHGLSNVLQQLIRSNVTNLDLVDTNLESLLQISPDDYFPLFEQLLDPQSGNLQVFHCSGANLPNEFMALLAGPSTLKTLVLNEPQTNYFMLARNPCLRRLVIVKSTCWRLTLPILLGILEHNRALKELKLITFKFTDEDDVELLATFVQAIHKYETLRSIEIEVSEIPYDMFLHYFTYKYLHTNADLLDARIKLEFVCSKRSMCGLRHCF